MGQSEASSEHKDWLDDDESQRILVEMAKRLNAYRHQLNANCISGPVEQIRLIKGKCMGIEMCIRLMERGIHAPDEG